MMRVLLLPALLLALTACEEQQSAAPEATPAAQEEPAQDAAAKPQASDTTRVLPCEALPSDVNFTPLAEQLRAAIAAKDAEFLLSLVPEDIRFSFGAENGKAAFVEEWQLQQNPSDSAIWEELNRMLTLGGYVEAYEDGTSHVIFPCTFRALPAENWMMAQNPQLDAYSYVVVTAHDGVLRDDSGNTLRPLSYGETLLRADGSQTRFQTHDGMEGTVDETAIRSPIDYRVFFRKEGDAWTMPLFIAGD